MADLGYDGKVAIITGASGGLGRQHALLLASRGAQVVINDLGGGIDGTGGSEGPAHTPRRRSRASAASPSWTRTGRHSRRRRRDREDRARRVRRVDIVINNAGILRDKRSTTWTRRFSTR